MNLQGYLLIAGILFYLSLVRVLDSKHLTPLKAAGIVVGGYFVVSTIIQGGMLVALGEPLTNLYGPIAIVTVLLQYIFATVVFYMISANEDSYMAYLGFGAAGLALIFFIAPAIARSIF